MDKLTRTRSEWLLILRRCRKKQTLDQVTERITQRLTGNHLIVFLGAADHRLAELTLQKHLDHIPKSVWHLVH